MRILAIETSCDETAVAVVETHTKQDEVLFTVSGNALYSQAKKHAAYGGVFPTLAKREHAHNLVPLLEAALEEAKLLERGNRLVDPATRKELQQILMREGELAPVLLSFAESIEPPLVDAVAVTHGPGLEPALWVGVNFAKALSLLWGIPLIPVNHLEGHILGAAVTDIASDGPRALRLPPLNFPILALIISGGHTELVHARSWGAYDLLGQTRDDAVGEAFDKVARMLDLPYPGGPHLSQLAAQGRAERHIAGRGLERTRQPLPRPMLNTKDFDFSFSGLKTAVLYALRNTSNASKEAHMELAAEFEDAVSEVLVKKVLRAMEHYPSHTLIVGGGVSANTHIQREMTSLVEKAYPSTKILFPTKGLSTDNAIMIALAASLIHDRLGDDAYESSQSLRAQGSLPLS